MKRLLVTFLFLLASLPAADETRVLLRTADAVPVEVLSKAADKAMHAALVTIIDKAKPSPTGDARDYISYARYWWPDPAKPGGLPFIRKDGVHNMEQVAAGDRKKIDDLVDNLTVLALGWTRLHREDCARQAGAWLRAWFVAPTTRMNPNLNYAQVRLGHDQNLGNASGVLDTRTFAEVVVVLRLLEGSPALTAEEEAIVRQWFSDYFHWLQTGKSALGEHKAENNHGSWFLVQAVAIAHYLGQDDLARQWCEEDKARIAWQFAADGSQPLEIARADGLHYSYFNLDAQLHLARQARVLGVDLWGYTASNGGSLRRGVAYLQPYNETPEKWPHNESEVLRKGFMDELLAVAATLETANPGKQN